MVFDFESGLAGPAQAGSQPAQQVSAARIQAVCLFSALVLLLTHRQCALYPIAGTL